MKIKPVSLQLRIKIGPNQQTYAKPVFAANGRIKPLYASLNGIPAHHPEGVYYLRYTGPNGKRVYENVGSDAAAAVTAKVRREHIQASQRLGIRVEGQSTPVIVPAATRLKIADARDQYVAEIRARKSEKTAARYAYEISAFTDLCGVLYVDEVTKPVVYLFMDALKTRGNSPRTVFNRVAGLITFLKHFGLASPLKKQELPRFTKKVATAYNPDELRKLFTAMTPDDRLVFQFFLGSGGREQEVMYACWSDLDFVSGVWSIKAKPDLGFKLKDHEERAVPLPDKLLEDLQTFRALHPDHRLIFKAVTGGVEGHFLRKLKRYALKAGLNCGHCVNKKGRQCDKHPVCKSWENHKFRKTFAYLHHESGVSARTLMDWLGHSDLETTLGYLKVADVRSTRTRTQVNKTFAAFAA